jgi:hypothetical protein
MQLRCAKHTTFYADAHYYIRYTWLALVALASTVEREAHLKLNTNVEAKRRV